MNALQSPMSIMLTVYKVLIYVLKVLCVSLILVLVSELMLASDINLNRDYIFMFVQIVSMVINFNQKLDTLIHLSFFNYIVNHIHRYIISDIQQVLHARSRDFVSAIDARDWDKVGSMFTSDGVLYRPIGMPVNGTQG